MNDIMCMVVSLIAIFASLYALGLVLELKGYISALRSAPVLREYVKEFVPIDNSEEAKKIVEERIKSSQREFAKAHGLAENDGLADILSPHTNKQRNPTIREIMEDLV